MNSATAQFISCASDNMAPYLCSYQKIAGKWCYRYFCVVAGRLYWTSVCMGERQTTKHNQKKQNIVLLDRNNCVILSN